MPAYQPDEGRERSRPYTASSGLEVILTGLPPLVPQRIDASIEYPEKPTYEVETASGDIEHYEHDEDSIKGDPEAEEAWAAYEEDLNEAETELTEKLLYSVLLESVELKDYEKKFADWKRKQKLLEIDIAEPSDPEDEESVRQAEEENKFYFMQTEVFHDADDIGEVLTIVMSLTGVSVEDLASARDSFPGEVESEPPAGNGDTTGELEDPGE
jgi:hypothetical protein